MVVWFEWVMLIPKNMTAIPPRAEVVCQLIRRSG